MLNRIAPILALVGVPMSIWYLGEYKEIWALFYCWFCLTILFWWYLANVVFSTSKKDRRNMAYRKVTGNRKGPAHDGTNSKVTQFKSNTRKENYQ